MTNISQQEYLDWLRRWFRNQTGGEPSIDEDKNYFDQGLVDSFKLLELIFSIEKEFKIKLSEQHFQDKRFSTIRGLAEIIQELKSKS